MKIFPLNPRAPALGLETLGALALAFFAPFVFSGAGTFLGKASSSLLASGLGGGAAGGSGALATGFEIFITEPQALHLAFASLPLILEGSNRYFFPHSSQITIIVQHLGDHVASSLRWTTDFVTFRSPPDKGTV
jgi:hypothetical protein